MKFNFGVLANYRAVEIREHAEIEFHPKVNHSSDGELIPTKVYAIHPDLVRFSDICVIHLLKLNFSTLPAIDSDPGEWSML